MSVFSKYGKSFVTVSGRCLLFKNTFCRFETACDMSYNAGLARSYLFLPSSIFFQKTKFDKTEKYS